MTFINNLEKLIADLATKVKGIEKSNFKPAEEGMKPNKGNVTFILSVSKDNHLLVCQTETEVSKSLLFYSEMCVGVRLPTDPSAWDRSTLSKVSGFIGVVSIERKDEAATMDIKTSFNLCLRRYDKTAKELGTSSFNSPEYLNLRWITLEELLVKTRDKNPPSINGVINIAVLEALEQSTTQVATEVSTLTRKQPFISRDESPYSHLVIERVKERPRGKSPFIMNLDFSGLSLDLPPSEDKK